MRLFALSLLVAASVAVQAQERSYELLLALDAGTKSVHRFDPFTGAYFGSFGAGYLVSPTGLTVDKASGMAYVRDGAQVLGFNYSTGALFSAITVPSTMSYNMGMWNGQLLLPGGADKTIWRYNPRSGAVLGSWAVPGYMTSIDSAIVADNGFVYGVGGYAGYMATPILNPNTGAVVGVGTMGFPNLLPQPATSGDWLVMQIDSATIFRMKMSPDGSTSLAAPYITGTNGVIAMSGRQGVAGGHASIYVCGKDALAPSHGLVGRWDTGLTFRGSFGAGQLVDPIHLAVVAAPEPTSLVAYGALLATYVWRRRPRR